MPPISNVRSTVAREQIAFADLIVLNKVDLLDPDDIALIFPRFCGHRVTRQPPLLRTRRGTDSQGSSGVAADYKILRGIQRFPAWRPPATDTGGDGLIPASTCQRSSRHTRCPSSFLDVTCFRSCLQPAVVAG